MLSKKEKYLIHIMHDMGFDEKECTAAFVYANTRKNRERLFDYLAFKGKYASMSDALSYIGTLERARGRRYQYLPLNFFVVYKGRNTKALTKDIVYKVKTVYGIKEDVYLLYNNEKEEKEYDASRFIRVRASTVIYRGFLDDDGKRATTEGFKIGKKYRVKEEKGLEYVLDDGREISCFEVDEISFVPRESKPISTIDEESLLHMLSHVFEFGDVRSVYKRMTDKTVYISKLKDLTLVGRENIYKYIKEVSHCRVQENYFSDVVLCTAEEDCDGHKKGERFLMEFNCDEERNSIFFKYDGTYITEILVDEYWPAFKCDETPLNNLAN